MFLIPVYTRLDTLHWQTVTTATLVSRSMNHPRWRRHQHEVSRRPQRIPLPRDLFKNPFEPVKLGEQIEEILAPAASGQA
jgi:hypothetical protein